MRRVESIQVMRFIAASMVVLCHCASGHFFVGSAGVDIFFVISGYIITGVMAKKNVASFVRDRLTRIYPPYWLALLPLLVLEWDGDFLRLLSSVSLWPIFGEFRRLYLQVGWTLSYEMLFYAGAAVVVWNRQMFWPL